MVMDATQPQQPSPQSVGREFVRQYYTLLNKAPSHLHRFYNNNSSFIHGESNLVVGQREIHNRIQQLNFNDCHAKISQVDAQATLGNGVVVQVTGELSNDGQPMRRFTQTFVLAAQSPKKYYVHNDIFRYQDHLYTDDDADGESRSENGEDHELQTAGTICSDQQSQTAITAVVADQQPPPQQLPAQVVTGSAGANVLAQQPATQPQQPVAPTTGGGSAPQQIYYSLPGARPVPVIPAAPQAAAVPLPAQFAAAANQQQSVQTSQLNGVVAHEELLTAQQAPLVTQNVSPIVQSSGAVPVATAGTPVGIVAVPPSVSVGITGFQQSPLVAPQLLQQPQQQVSNTPTQQNLLLSSQAAQPTGNVANAVETDENVAIHSTGNNETSTRTSSIAAAPKPPTPVAVDDFKTINEQQQQEKYEAAKQQQNEPKTYANLFKSTSSSPSGFVNAALQQQQQLQQQQNLNNVYHSTASTSTTNYTTTTSISSYSNSRLDNNLNNGSLPQRTNSIRSNKDYEQRRPSNAQFGDNQQLFLGNIPHHASEEDLRALFSRFGTILELRILSKAGNKLPPGVRNPLNYGFITYEDAESVQKCLANCPLYFPENSPDGQKLNVEEKKPRMRNDIQSRQPLGGNNMNNNIGRSIGSGNGPQSRSIANNNSGGVMRNNTTNGGGLSRSGGGSGGGGGPRLGGSGGFQRNDNRSGGASNGPMRGGGGNSQSGSTYNRR